MGKVSKNFDGAELLPKGLYDRFGDLAIRYLNPKIILVAQAMADFYKKPVRVNSWKTGGIDGRTIRLAGDKSFNLFSDHTYGNAIDFDIVGKSSLDIYNDILNNPLLNAILRKIGVTAMEKNRPTWVHLSVSDMGYWTQCEVVNGIKLLTP